MMDPVVEPNAASNDPWRGGCVAALVIGLITIVVFYGSGLLLAAVSLRSISSEEWPIILWQVLLVALPFGLLALAGIRARMPWLVAIGLTIGFWVAFFVSILIASRNGTGVNIGMALIMLVSPILIVCGAWTAASVSSRRS